MQILEKLHLINIYLIYFLKYSFKGSKFNNLITPTVLYLQFHKLQTYNKLINIFIYQGQYLKDKSAIN